MGKAADTLLDILLITVFVACLVGWISVGILIAAALAKWAWKFIF